MPYKKDRICFCMRLKHGTIFIAVMCTIIAMGVVAVSVMLELKGHPEENKVDPNLETVSVASEHYIAVIIIAVLELAINLMLLFAAILEIDTLLLPWIIIRIVLVTMMCIFLPLTAVTLFRKKQILLGSLAIVTVVIYEGLAAYAIHVVHMFHEALTDIVLPVDVRYSSQQEGLTAMQRSLSRVGLRRNTSASATEASRRSLNQPI